MKPSSRRFRAGDSVRNDVMRTLSDMHAVALAATDGMLSFELTIASEVFGDDPRYDFAVCGSAPVRVGRFVLEPDDGLDRLARAGTVIVPGWADVDADPPAGLIQAGRAAHPAGAGGAARRPGPGRGWRPSARARSCWPRPACWTASARRRTGRPPTSSPPGSRG